MLLKKNLRKRRRIIKHKNNKRHDRASKVERGETKTVKQKFQGGNYERLTQFELDKWQKEMQNTIRANTITFVDSYAGVGKTFAALHYAVQQYLDDPSVTITVVRSPTDVGEDKLGALPGAADTSMEGKLGVHFESTKAILRDLIGGRLEADLDKRIFFKIPNFCLGATWSGVVIIDESQLLSPLILKLLLERTGEFSKVIVLGSSGQLYENTKKRNALRDALKRFFNSDGSKKYDDIGKYKFPLEAVKRNDVVIDVIRAYEVDEI